MEQFQEQRESAIRKLANADHMLNMTYPLVKDPRLLLAIVENLFLAMTNAMNSILYYERTFKKIPAFPENFEFKLKLFSEQCVQKYKIEKESVPILRKLKQIILEHKKSPVEFARSNAFIICNKDYKMEKITPELLKAYLSKAKVFIGQTKDITKENERIFRRSSY